jgi:TIR domain
MPKPARDQVFISYSHRDRVWFEKLTRMLSPMVRNKSISVWDDTKIEASVRWRVEIEGALAAAKVAVLLVSPNFLASDFIAENELPPLLNAAAKGGLAILWVYVSSCLYDETEIGDYQSAHSVSKPLDYLRLNVQNTVLVDVCRKIKTASGSAIRGEKPVIKSLRPEEILPQPPRRAIVAANASDATAMFDLGLWYEERKHQDYAKAREWYQKAAQAGHKGAMVSVAEEHPIHTQVVTKNILGCQSRTSTMRTFANHASPRDERPAKSSKTQLYATPEKL